MLEFNLLFWLFTKHIIADYYTQYPWMYKYKGVYGHIGGLSHSLWHGLLTFIVVNCFIHSWSVALLYGLLDFIFHYHIDYCKSKAWRKYNLEPTGQKYWIIHGTDQFAHGMTYFLIVHLIGHGYV